MSMNIFRTLDNAKLKAENVRGLLNTVHISSGQLIHINKFTPNEFLNIKALLHVSAIIYKQLHGVSILKDVYNVIIKLRQW